MIIQIPRKNVGKQFQGSYGKGWKCPIGNCLLHVYTCLNMDIKNRLPVKASYQLNYGHWSKKVKLSSKKRRRSKFKND